MKYLSVARIKSEIANSKGSPQLTAFSLAMGIGLALGPLPGLHLIVGFVLVKLTRLNPVLMLLGILIHNPWTMIPIHMFALMIGDLILYQDLVSLEQFTAFPWGSLGFSTVFSSSFWQTNGSIFLSFIKPFVFGSLALSSIGATLGYRLTLAFYQKLRKEDPHVPPNPT